MSDEHTPLWSNERIIRRISIHPQIYAAIIKMRDEYEAALATAREQEWEPVPDGDYGLIGIQHDGERLCLYVDEPCRLPEGWRLMRPRAGGEKTSDE